MFTDLNICWHAIFDKLKRKTCFLRFIRLEKHMSIMELCETHKNLSFTVISTKKIIEIQGWLLLTFFICLHNQLSSSFNSIIVQLSEKRDSSSI